MPAQLRGKLRRQARDLGRVDLGDLEREIGVALKDLPRARFGIVIHRDLDTVGKAIGLGGP